MKQITLNGLSLFELEELRKKVVEALRVLHNKRRVHFSLRTEINMNISLMERDLERISERLSILRSIEDFDRFTHIKGKLLDLEL